LQNQFGLRFAMGNQGGVLNMMSKRASDLRTYRGFLLLVVLVSSLAQIHAEDGSCKAQSVPVSPAVWGQIPPPHDGVTVTYYDGLSWVGLNHTYAGSQSLTHRWRSFIPWMSSGIVSVFPFGRAIQSLASRMPLFYVSHTAAAIDASEPDARWVHLVRADTQHNARSVQVTSGWSAFNFHPGFSAREEMPIKFDVLSRAVYTIQPLRILDDGEYLVIFGRSALSGFEFEIACSGAHHD
jgi:hypothetical protein